MCDCDLDLTTALTVKGWPVHMLIWEAEVGCTWPCPSST